MIRSKLILGSTGLALTLSLAAGCYLQREAFNFDNDADGWDEVVDCNDDDPNINPDVRETGAACNDGVDNDCDGKVDFVDPECDGEIIGQGGSSAGGSTADGGSSADGGSAPGTGGAGGDLGAGGLGGAGGSSAGGASAGGSSAGGSSAGGSSAGGSSAGGNDGAGGT